MGDREVERSGRQHSIIAQKYLGKDDVMSVFLQYNTIEDELIFCLNGVHWVALTSDIYFDDSKHYKVRDHERCITKLEEMNEAYPDDDASSHLDKGD